MEIRRFNERTKEYDLRATLILLPDGKAKSDHPSYSEEITFLGNSLSCNDGAEYLKALAVRYFAASYYSVNLTKEDSAWAPNGLNKDVVSAWIKEFREQGKNRTKRQEGIFTVKADGTITDKDVVDSLLADEDRIRQELIDKGVIDNIVLVRKKGEKEQGIFYTIGQDGQPTDKNVADGMMEHDEEIQRDLVKHGVIKQYYVKDTESKEVTEGEEQKEKPKHKMTKEEYLKTHLQGMDEATRQRYLRQMETYTSEDYSKATHDILDQMGEPTEELKNKVKKLLKGKYGVKRNF